MFSKVKFYVKNEHGCILAGCVSREDAEKKRAEWEKRYRENPFGSQDMKVFVVAK